MDDDIDFDDLLGEERAALMTAKRPVFDAQAAPSLNELRLGKRVLELEKERDALAAELTALRANQATSPSIPIPSDLSPNPASTGAVVIPHDLLPTLQLLRSHISDLTRDNAALRYTFLGEPTAGPSRLSQNVTPRSPLSAAIPSSPLPSLDQASISDQAPITTGTMGETLRAQGADVEKVLSRVKALMLENEELGEMVLEAGRNNGAESEWQKALEESRAVIESLDSDLTHHLATIQSLRAELKTAQSQSKPPASPIPPSGPSASRPTSIMGRPTPTAPSSASLSIKGAGAGGGHRHQPGKSLSGHKDRDADRARDKDRERPRERIRDKTESVSESTGSGRGEKHRDREEKDGGKDAPRGPREDRDYKRRR